MEINVGRETIYFNKSIDEFLSNFNNNKFIICDSLVYNYYKDEINNYNCYIYDAVEDNKNIESLLEIASFLINNGFTKGDLLVGFGGGVLLDTVGFLATILYRGTPHVFIPTTLLSMVDASIGGKNGVDFLGQKNILGTINEPLSVLINDRYLNTLAKDELLSGFGEIIKYKYLDSNLNLNDQLINIIRDCVLIKKDYVEKDLNDNNLRMMLNFGHTFGHQIELKYSLKHGYAVICGIYLILELEHKLGLIDYKLVTDYIDLLNKYNINLLDLDYLDYIDLIFKDKKNRNGKLNLIFIDNSNKPFIYKISKEELYDKLKIRN